MAPPWSLETFLTLGTNGAGMFFLRRSSQWMDLKKTCRRTDSASSRPPPSLLRGSFTSSFKRKYDDEFWFDARKTIKFQIWLYLRIKDGLFNLGFHNLSSKFVLYTHYLCPTRTDLANFQWTFNHNLAPKCFSQIGSCRWLRKVSLHRPPLLKAKYRNLDLYASCLSP